MFPLPTLNYIMSWDAKWSNDMHDCWWAKVFAYIFSLNFFSSRVFAFKDVDIFHLTFYSLKIELQINTLKLYSILQSFYCQEVKFLTFLLPDVKDIWVYKGRIKGLCEKHRSWSKLYLLFYFRKDQTNLVCFFLLDEFQHDYLTKDGFEIKRSWMEGREDNNLFLNPVMMDH